MDDPLEQKAFEFVQALGEDLSSGKLRLPAFPDIALRVRRALDDPNANTDKIVRVVGSDPILAARLLQAARSSIYYHARPVSNLNEAVIRLGHKMVRNTAMSVAMEQIFQAKSMGALKSHLRELWYHGINVAATAFVLAKRAGGVSQDDALLAGLFHDIGKYYILVRVEAYPELFGEQSMLRRLLEEWHTGVGRAILEVWGLAEDICVAADEHDTLDREHLGPPDLTDVVTVANLHANLGSDDDPHAGIDWTKVPAFAKLNLSPDDSIEIIKASQRDTAALVQALSGT